MMGRACLTCSGRLELPRGGKGALWEGVEVLRSYDSAILIKETSLPLLRNLPCDDLHPP
jgi:hypothetical protein